MEALIGIQFKDFVLLAADRMNMFSIIVVKHDVDKIHRLHDHLLMAVSGEPGDSIQFAEYISKNIKLYRMRNGFDLSPASAAHFTQRNLANYLRSRTPYHVNLLIGGYNTRTQEPSLYHMDYLATSVQVPFGVHGYGGSFVLGLLDRIYKADCSVEEGIEMMKKCIAEIQKRLVINLPAFKLCMIDKNGHKDLPDISVEPIKIGDRFESRDQQVSPMVH
ncbi:Proteasome subunit beta type-2 [Sarcoptes scabiei]|uniref:Proteasome subunit beta n=1 Tax=Sarcoptes scabiei TaxID=52283 RepID=A0A131ZV17_SARSC|nr:Proteasome subunit beta type-2 [Sarcoptes scabiei]KPM02567.1 proteasome subunit beta type-2-like protein [Sarcoptes scabiei]UXI20452.1 ribosomal protein S19 [Sarcoptes scabiei]